MERKQLLIIALLAALLAAAWVRHPIPDPESTPDVAGVGYRVYVDRATGAITTEPTDYGPVVLDDDARNALSTSSEGLREEPSPVAGGGVMVNLKGRFQNVSVAAVGPDGELVAPCVSGLPADSATVPVGEEVDHGAE